MTHFVAAISIRKVETMQEKKDSTYNAPTVEKRKVSTVANITVSAGTIEELRFKVNAHVELVDDGGDIEAIGKVMRGGS